jgi:tetratricopeptide (TPR) repeat protein
LPVRAFAVQGLLTALLISLLPASNAQAQELTLKRDLPPVPDSPCALVSPSVGGEPDPSAERRSEAEDLATEANRAAILGEQARAVSLLEDAADLDPSSPVIAYRLGRMLEDGGSGAAALRPYCRYLALAPDGPEAADVRARIERIGADQLDDGPSPAARGAFEAGIEAFDRGRYEVATQSFSRALREHPDWADAYYNRGLAEARAGGRGAASSDLERYLELRPDALDHARVSREIRQLRVPAAPTFRPYVALAAGLVVPGMGHVYSGRPATGLLVLAAAGAAAATGILYTEVEVRCRGAVVDGACPPNQVAERIEDQPLLVPGLATAGAITLAGAVHAFLASRRGSAGGFVAAGALEVPAPALAVGGTQTVLRLEPGDGWRGDGLRAMLQVRF